MNSLLFHAPNLAYQASEQVQEKAKVLQETQTYTANALIAVAEHIHTVGEHLTTYLVDQSNDLSGLRSTVSHIDNQVRTLKEEVGSANPSVRTLEGGVQGLRSESARPMVRFLRKEELPECAVPLPPYEHRPFEILSSLRDLQPAATYRSGWDKASSAPSTSGVAQSSPPVTKAKMDSNDMRNGGILARPVTRPTYKTKVDCTQAPRSSGPRTAPPASISLPELSPSATGSRASNPRKESHRPTPAALPATGPGSAPALPSLMALPSRPTGLSAPKSMHQVARSKVVSRADLNPPLAATQAISKTTKPLPITEVTQAPNALCAPR